MASIRLIGTRGRSEWVVRKVLCAAHIHLDVHIQMHTQTHTCAWASIFMVYPPFRLRLTFLWHELGHRVLHEACAEFIEFLRNISLYKTGFLDFFCKTVFRCCCCYFYFYLVSCSLLLPFGRAPLLFFSSMCMWVCMCLCVSAVSICVWFRFDCLRNRILKIQNKYVQTHTHTYILTIFMFVCM